MQTMQMHLMQTISPKMSCHRIKTKLNKNVGKPS